VVYWEGVRFALPASLRHIEDLGLEDQEEEMEIDNHQENELNVKGSLTNRF